MFGISSIAARIKEGDIGAFEEVFGAYYYQLCLYSCSITGSAEAAEDVVQELFYKWWRDKDKMHIKGSVKSYLYGATRNNSLSYIGRRRPGNIDVAHNAVHDTGSADAQRVMESNEFASLVEKAITSLPERRREIFLLHREEGKMYKDIADSMGLSVKTIEAEMTKAYATLRKEIENYNL